MEFHPLESTDKISEGYIKPFSIGDIKLLLIQHDGQIYVIENRCGHFGIPLDTGKVEDGTIICSQHSISFSLTTGEIVNRPYENADPVKIFDVVHQDGKIGVIL